MAHSKTWDNLDTPQTESRQNKRGWLMPLLLVIVFIAIAAILAYFLGDMLFRRMVNEEVDKLFSNSQSETNVFSYDMLEALPPPVQTYFHNNIREGAPIIYAARLHQTGQLRTTPEQAWLDIRAEQYYNVPEVGFIWFTETKMFGLPIIGRDASLDGQGSMKIRLLSLIPIVNVENNPEINQASLMRYLSELMWLPSALLPSEQLKWEAIDDTHARAILNVHDMEVSGVFSFNENGDIIQFQGQRYYESDLKPWGGIGSDYQWFGDYRIPSYGAAIWYFEDGDFEYGRFTITDVEYNIPERYQ